MSRVRSLPQAPRRRQGCPHDRLPVYPRHPSNAAIAPALVAPLPCGLRRRNTSSARCGDSAGSPGDRVHDLGIPDRPYSASRGGRPHHAAPPSTGRRRARRRTSGSDHAVFPLRPGAGHAPAQRATKGTFSLVGPAGWDRLDTTDEPALRWRETPPPNGQYPSEPVLEHRCRPGHGRGRTRDDDGQRAAGAARTPRQGGPRSAADWLGAARRSHRNVPGRSPPRRGGGLVPRSARLTMCQAPNSACSRASSRPLEPVSSRSPRPCARRSACRSRVQRGVGSGSTTTTSGCDYRARVGGAGGPPGRARRLHPRGEFGTLRRDRRDPRKRRRPRLAAGQLRSGPIGTAHRPRADRRPAAARRRPGGGALPGPATAMPATRSSATTCSWRRATGSTACCSACRSPNSPPCAARPRRSSIRSGSSRTPLRPVFRS